MKTREIFFWICLVIAFLFGICFLVSVVLPIADFKLFHYSFTLVYIFRFGFLTGVSLFGGATYILYQYLFYEEKEKKREVGDFSKEDFDATSALSIQKAFSDSGTDKDYKEWINAKELKD